MKHFSTFGNEPTVLGAASRQTGHRVNISPETLHLENNLMMLLVKSGFISVTFAFASDWVIGRGARGDGADICKNRVHWRARLLVSSQRP